MERRLIRELSSHVSECSKGKKERIEEIASHTVEERDILRNTYVIHNLR